MAKDTKQIIDEYDNKDEDEKNLINSKINSSKHDMSTAKGVAEAIAEATEDVESRRASVEEAKKQE